MGRSSSNAKCQVLTRSSPLISGLYFSLSSLHEERFYFYTSKYSSTSFFQPRVFSVSLKTQIFEIQSQQQTIFFHSFFLMCLFLPKVMFADSLVDSRRAKVGTDIFKMLVNIPKVLSCLTQGANYQQMRRGRASKQRLEHGQNA